MLMKQVLAGDPKHPGAHHYRIHNWDDEDGVTALDSCRAYGDIAPASAMRCTCPGTSMPALGMFHESAISLDSATRAEIAYMGRQMVFPYNTWNYAHNRNYLSYVQEQLGMPAEAMRGARELLAVPLDPKLTTASTGQSAALAGHVGASRALIKFERWDEILKDGSIPWGDSLRDKLGRRYAEAMARLGKKDRRGGAEGGRRPRGAQGGHREDSRTPRSSASSRCRTSSCAARSCCSRARRSRG